MTGFFCDTIGAMRCKSLLVAAGALATLTACATDTREWMKLNEKYTTEEFRRDLKSCSGQDDKIDDACMKRLGWVAVSPGRDSRPSDPYGPAQQGRPKAR